MIKTNCTICKAKLNPYFIRNIGYEKDQLTIMLECIQCHQYNYVTQEMYFLIKRDYDMPRMQPINLKLPSQLHVIFLSLERCGISWIIKELSRAHEKMFGKPIKFKTEVSTVEATRTKLPMFDCWANVYSVDPKELLKKPYDKIIIVQRPWITLKWVHLINFPKDMPESQRNKLLEKAEKEYQMIYEQPLDDPRVMKIQLRDLNNNYTEATFEKLMDFLNFPSEGRPNILPTQLLEPNWEAYSTVLDPSVPLGSRLQNLDDFWELNKEGFLQYKAEQNSNPRKIDLPNIVIIGPRIDVGCHISENLYYAFIDKGCNTELLPLETLGWNDAEGLPYRQGKRLYPLSKALEHTTMKTPDLVFIDEPEYYLYNDLPRDIPVFYAQREFKRPPKVFYPDIAFFWHQNILNYFRQIFARHWAANTRELGILSIAVNPKNFIEVEKKYKGISFLAGRETILQCSLIKELTSSGLIETTRRETLEVIALGIFYIHDGEDKLSDQQFRDYLAQCEAIWVQLPRGQFTSRRMVEAMLVKTICVMQLENEEHERVLESMGYKAWVHYVKINELKDMVELHKNWDYEKMKEMAEKAYDVTIKRNTYACRAEQLIEMYKDFALRKKGVIIE